MEKCDSFERRQAVVDSIVELFKGFGVERNYFKGRRYILYIETTGEAKEEVFRDLTSKNTNGLTLNEEIMDSLSMKGFEISSIELRQGAPEGELDQVKRREIKDVVLFLEETTIKTSSPTVPSKVMRARITLALGSPGALKQPEGYEIDSEHVPYNIGRVIEPGDNSNRVNHIEIIDKTREYSSRSLAHIDYSEAVGFYIQREKPTETNSVEIIRKNETKMLKNESATVVLKDGDRLRLRHIMLDFHMISE